jgi:hypothetical protein
VVVAVEAGAASTSAMPATAIGMNLRILEPPGLGTPGVSSLFPLDVRAP